MKNPRTETIGGFYFPEDALVSLVYLVCLVYFVFLVCLVPKAITGPFSYAMYAPPALFATA